MDVALEVAVFVKVLVRVAVGVKVAVLATVLVTVEVAVRLAVGVAVFVAVFVRVAVRVKVGVFTGVLVRVAVGVPVGVLVAPVELEPGITIKSISLGWRLTVKVVPVVWVTPAMDAILAGAGFTVPLIERLVASWVTPPVLPEGSISQARPDEAGVNPDTVTVVAMVELGLLFTR